MNFSSFFRSVAVLALSTAALVQPQSSEPDLTLFASDAEVAQLQKGGRIIWTSEGQSEVVAQVPIEPWEVAATDFRARHVPFLILTKSGALFRVSVADEKSEWIDHKDGGNLALYRDPKTLDSCVLGHHVHCYRADSGEKYSLYDGQFSPARVVAMELRFDSPRVAALMLDDHSILLGQEQAEEVWAWRKTDLQVPDGIGFAVSGQDESHVYVIRRGEHSSPLSKLGWLEVSPRLVELAFPYRNAEAVLGVIGADLFLRSEGRIVRFDARTEESSDEGDASGLASVYVSASPRGQSIAAVRSNGTVRTSSFNKGSCAVSVASARTRRPESYMSMGSNGGSWDLLVKLQDDKNQTLRRNCIFEFGGIKTGFIETWNVGGTHRIASATTGTTVKVRVYPNRSFQPSIRLILMNRNVASAAGNGPVVIAQGGLRNPSNACEVRTLVEHQTPIPQGRQLLVVTTVTDTNPACAGQLAKVSVLMCNAAGGQPLYTFGPIAAMKVSTGCVVDTRTSSDGN